MLRLLLTTGTQNLENKLEDGVLEALMYLSLSQCGSSNIWRMSSMYFFLNHTHELSVIADMELQMGWTLESLVLILLTSKVSWTLDFLYYHKSHDLFNKYSQKETQKVNSKNNNLHNSILFDTLGIHKIYSKWLIEWKMTKSSYMHHHQKGFFPQ